MSDRNKESLFSCPNLCWMIAVVLGFAAFMVALSKLEQGAFISMLVGIVVFFVAGWLLGKVLCSASEAPTQTATAKPVVTPQPVSEAPTASEAPVVVELDVKPSPLVREEKLATSKATLKDDAEKPTPKAPKAKATPAAQKTVVPENVSETKPRTMKAPRKAGADDLKLLKGVGPKLEQTLNELGFFHYDQVAKWSDAEIEWVDARLRFKGRIERDGWIEQAKILAGGGETEFSTRGKKA
ncbi:hypothetical protein AB9F29_03460 [Falsihalocynthiibacter sp. S25ZX9]|uniref:hypothetical protein n=1 Tax=Falsihalocynthiibacter sp. S25ZX9 TaxID=3240870 RepID=UPI00350F9CE7